MEATKARKDLAQAAALLDVLFDTRPWDVEEAWASIRTRPPSWAKGVVRGAEGLPDNVRRRVMEVLGVGEVGG